MDGDRRAQDSPGVVLRERVTVDRRPPLLWMAAAGLTLFLLMAVTVFAAYAAWSAREQGETNSTLLLALERQAATDERAAVAQRETARAAVEKVLADGERLDVRQQAELRSLLNQALALITAEVRDPSNRERRPTPAVTVGPRQPAARPPAPQPSGSAPAATPRPTGPSQPRPTAAPAPTPLLCRVPLLCELDGP